ncbi:hypothetical protein BH23PSE1_BH23PSE1_12040 [soil metagenome]
MKTITAAATALAACLSLPALAQQSLPPALNDYPTEARAEYVFACMAVNGQNADMLRRCSCSVDVIASILPYRRYVQAEAVLAMLQTTGERISAVRESAMSAEMIADLRRAQAEADIRCFF